MLTSSNKVVLIAFGAFKCEHNCRRWGSRARPSIGRPRHCTGSGLARKYKVGLRPISEMESPPVWNPGILYNNWIPRKIPRNRLQRSGSKTGYGLCSAHPTFWLASVCVYILLPLIIQLFPYYCLVGTYFTFIVYPICTLVLLMLAWNGK